jgi:hypothetical protein
MNTNQKSHFVIPFLFKGAPRPAVMLYGELRGKDIVSIYTDSPYKPFLLKNKEMQHEIPYEEAVSVVEAENAIWVKENFDTDSIEDLREIKDKLPVDWVKSFNESLSELG